MSQQTMFKDTPSVIGSRALEAGVSHSDSPVGPMTDLFGQVPVPANPSPARAKAKAPPIVATSGPKCSGSSNHAGRKKSLASKSHPQKLSALSLRLISLSRFGRGILLAQTNSPTNSPEANPYTTRLGGSMEYEQTWRRRATPSGLMFWEHTASAPRISASELTGWPSPMAGTPAQNGTTTAAAARSLWLRDGRLRGRRTRHQPGRTAE